MYTCRAVSPARSVNGPLVQCERFLTELNWTGRVRTFTANVRFHAVQFSSDEMRSDDQYERVRHDIIIM